MTGMDRRTIVRGVAWSVPVVAVATAAPAFAASGFACSGGKWCKVEGSKNNKWDFRYWPGTCANGTIQQVKINGMTAEYVPATRNRAAYYRLRNQPHSYTFKVTVYDAEGRIGFDKVVDTRQSSCG